MGMFFTRTRALYSNV